eukprot:403363283
MKCIIHAKQVILQQKSVSAYQGDNRQAQTFNQGSNQSDQNHQSLNDLVNDPNYIPPNEGVYRTGIVYIFLHKILLDQLISDQPEHFHFFRSSDNQYNYPRGSQNQNQNYQPTPFLNDLFFGAPITESLKNKYNGAKSYIGKMWGSYMKGVSAGGEEFTVKLDKIIAKDSKRPSFLHGTMSEIVVQFDGTKPLLLYFSGEDKISKHFEKDILTKEGIIKFMNENFLSLGLNANSNEGLRLRKALDPNQIIPSVLIMKIVKETNTSEINAMIDGKNLVNLNGDYYLEFLQNAYNAFIEDKKEQMNEQNLQPNQPSNFDGEELKEDENKVLYEQEDEDFKLAQQLQQEFYEQQNVQQNPLQHTNIQQKQDDFVMIDSLKKKQEQEQKQLQEQLQIQQQEEAKYQLKNQRENLLNLKIQRLGEEPASDNPDIVQIAFRKPNGNERIQRRFLKDDLIEKLYDFIDTLDQQIVGFEVNKEGDDISYELVLPPQPQIKTLNDKTKTLKEEGITRSSLINIKQI